MEVKRLWMVLLLLLTLPGPALAAARPTMTMAELAFYSGADRQQLLEEGARREGKLTFYTSGAFDSIVSPILAAFKKKYPFVTVDMWRGTSPEVASRTMEEAKAGRNMVDVIEGTQVAMIVLQRVGLVQPFASPQFAQIEEEAKTTVPGGVVAVAYRSSGIGFGYNTKLVSKDQLPKTYEDLLNPKWKGKLAIAGSNTGAGWLGAVKNSGGEELLKKIAAQNYPVQMVSAMALVQIVATGEYAASPTLIDANVYVTKLKGAPMDWTPLEPVRVNIGQIAIAKKAQNPYAAMLFTDFQISKEVGEILRVRSYDSFRRDVAPVGQRYKKYFGVDTAEEIVAEEALFKKLFISKQ